jgi:hypothetical protein
LIIAPSALSVIEKPRFRQSRSMPRFSASTWPIIERSPRARHVDQLAHQAPAESLALPVVGDDEGELAALAVGIGDVACHADLGLAAVLRHRGDERHLAVVVDLREAHQHLRRQLAQRVHEAEVARLGREVLYQ